MSFGSHIPRRGYAERCVSKKRANKLEDHRQDEFMYQENREINFSFNVK